MSLLQLKSTAGGTLLYITDHLAYEKRNDLNLYEKSYSESTFVEITNLTNTNIIMGLSADNQQWILMNSIVITLIHF